MALKKRLLPKYEQGTDEYVGKQFKTSRFSEELFTIKSLNKDAGTYNITYVDKTHSIVTVNYSAKILRKNLKINSWILIN